MATRKIRDSNYMKIRRSLFSESKKEERRTQERAYNAVHRKHLKDQVFNHGWKCSCCGESIIEFLTIDHINGGGGKHRKETGWGARFYRWLIKNNFPSEFRTLCMNCNWGRKLGTCPHEKLKKGNVYK